MDEHRAWSLSDEQLLRLGRDALARERYREAADTLQEYCARLARQERAIAPSVLAHLGLAVGQSGDVREGLKICLEALSSDRRDPNICLCVARLYVLSGSKKNAINVIAQGLRARPSHRGLNALRASLGVRQTRAIRFLPRESAVNVRLGRALRKLKGKTGPRTSKV